VRNIVLRSAAEDDLIEIYRYIAQRSDNAETAIGYIRRIRTWWYSVLNFPESGRRRDDLLPGIEFWVSSAAW
jgi:plasmid stabilization system protein ParE